MSETLLKKFIEFIDEEDGVIQKRKKKLTVSEKQKIHVRKVLNAASKGQVELPSEESYLAQGTSKDDVLSERLAQQGYSLIEQMRDHKPKDLAKRNMKYFKYCEETALDPKKIEKIISMTTKKRENPSKIIRRERAKLTGLREPKPGEKKKKNGGSVFSEADFAVNKKKKLKPVSRFDFT